MTTHSYRPNRRLTFLERHRVEISAWLFVVLLVGTVALTVYAVWG